MNHAQFMIFAEARSGSTTLVKFFQAIGVKIESEPQDGIVLPDFIETCFQQWDAIKYISTIPNIFRSMTHAIDALDQGIRVIHLKRRDTLRQAISLALNFMNEETKEDRKEKRESHEYREWARGKKVEVRDVHLWIEQLSHAAALFDEAFQGHDSVLDVYYEDLYSGKGRDTFETVGEMLDFISLPTPTGWNEEVWKWFDTSLKDTTDETLRALANFEEINQRFHGQLAPIVQEVR